MRNQTHFFILAISLLTLVTNTFGQYESRGKEFDYVDAESFFNAGNYYDALPLYEALMNVKGPLLNNHKGFNSMKSKNVQNP